MTPLRITIRPIAEKDHARWLELWRGYCLFYGAEPDPVVTDHTWQRMTDGSGRVIGAVAVDENDHVIGIANYLLHENTSTLAPVCYLQDLFVDPAARGDGVGKHMLEWLSAEMKRHGWARVYWATKENNYRARGLYDKFTPHSGFLRYVMYNAVDK